MFRRRVAASVGSVLALLLSMLVVTAAPASAAEERYDVPAGGAWEIQGRGWGHGIGMSQWGAKGAAEQGLGYRAILGFYYQGTTVAHVPDSPLAVRLSAMAPTNTVTVWNPTGQNRLFVGAPGGAQTEWGAGHLTATRVGNGYVVKRRQTPTGPVVQEQTFTGSELQIRSGTAGSPGEQGLAVARDQSATSGTWYRGEVRLRPSTVAGTFDVINLVKLEQYLYGVVPRESPAHFHREALRAQAVAARSYVLAEGKNPTCDTTACQVYGGRATVNRAGTVMENKEHANTTRAVDDTRGEIRSYNGQPAFTQFSSTNGGHTTAGSDPARHPYLVAKPDPYTGTAAGDTRTTWTDTLRVSTLEQHCPRNGKLRTLVITDRNGNGAWGGRITGVRLECTTGNVSPNVSLRFGMFSTWWKPTAGVEPPSGFYLNDSWGPKANHEFAFGRPGDIAIAGDWDGNGIDTVGIRRANTYHLTSAHDGRTARTIAYGRPGDEVLIGDWNGDGTDTLAVRRGNLFYINNSLASGPATTVIGYGRAGDEVFVGDWNGDGTDTLAVRRGNLFHVRNTMTSGPAHTVFGYGRPGDVVLTGDWDGNGTDTIAVRRGHIYHVRNSLTAGPAERMVPYGRPGDVVLVGDWDGNGTDTLGVHRVQ